MGGELPDKATADMLAEVDAKSSHALDMHGRLEIVREIVVVFVSSMSGNSEKQKEAILHSIAYGGLGGVVIVASEEVNTSVDLFLHACASIRGDGARSASVVLF